MDRRNMVRLTAAGLIHITARPSASLADEPTARDLVVRQAAQRGHTNLGWLDSYHSFSFGGYYDQQRMGFRSLRVINDDRIAAGRGFPTHPHRDVEIVSYVLDGALEHRDSTGQGAVVRPGDVQLMRAGTGIRHSEYNPSRSRSNHFLQIWIEPSQNGLRPGYQQLRVKAEEKQNRWRLIAAPGRQPGAVAVHQDVHLLATCLEPRNRLSYSVKRGRNVWLQVARGGFIVNGTRVQAGDAVATSRPTELHLEGIEKSEALLFDLG